MCAIVDKKTTKAQITWRLNVPRVHVVSLEQEICGFRAGAETGHHPAITGLGGLPRFCRRDILSRRCPVSFYCPVACHVVRSSLDRPGGTTNELAFNKISYGWCSKPGECI